MGHVATENPATAARRELRASVGRRRRRTPLWPLLLTLALATSIGVAALGELSGPDGGPGAAGPVQAAAAGTAREPIGFTPQPALTTFAGHGYDSTLLTQPTRAEAQSKLWFHNGSWWGVLFSPAADAFHIHQLDWSTQVWRDTGTLVDERLGASADALSQGDLLYLVSGGDGPSALDRTRLLRYRYDRATRRYDLDPGFPVSVTPEGARSVVLARDTTGQLWIAYVKDQRLRLNRSLEDERVWGEPFTPDIDGVVTAVDTATVTRFGKELAVVWSNQRDDAFYLARHHDADPDAVWQPTRTLHAGQRIADDHVTATALNGDLDAALYVAVKTSASGRDVVNPLDPQVLLFAIEPDGSVRRYLVGHVRDRHTTPVVLIDRDRRRLYVILSGSATEGRRGVFAKWSDLDHIAFETGLGMPLIVSETDPAIVAPTSTKQNLDRTSGLLVLAADDASGRYLHGAMSLGGVTPGERLGQEWPGRPEPVRAPPVFRDTFDRRPIASPPGSGWYAHTGKGPDAGSVTIAPSTGGPDSRSVLAVTGADGSSVRVCKPFAPIASRLDTSLDVRFGESASRAVVTILQGGDAEAAVVRIDRDGAFTVHDGTTPVRTEVRPQPGQWYRSRVLVDIAARTYNWTLQERGRLEPLAHVTDLDWPSAGAGPVAIDEICLRTPSGRSGLQLWFDDVAMHRG